LELVGIKSSHLNYFNLKSNISFIVVELAFYSSAEPLLLYWNGGKYSIGIFLNKAQLPCLPHCKTEFQQTIEVNCIHKSKKKSYK